MPSPPGMSSDHRNARPEGAGSYSGTSPVPLVAGEEEQGLANVFPKPVLDDWTLEFLSLEVEPWTQEVVGAAPSLEMPLSAGGGVVQISGGGSVDPETSTAPLQITSAEEFRKRRAKHQREYLKRRQNEAKATKQSVEMARNQVVAARAEHTALQLHSSVLQKMVDYKDGVATAINRLFGAAQESVFSNSAYQVASNALKLLMAKATVPNESQIRKFMLRQPFEDVERQVMDTQIHMAGLLKTWEDSPTSRSIIESHLELRKTVRKQSGAVLAEERPYIMLRLIERRAVPLGADGLPNQIVRNAVTAMDLSPDQIEEIRKQWIRYQQDVTRSRRAALEALQKASGICPPESEGLDDISASSAARRFLEIVDMNHTLEEYSSQEGVALIQLILAFNSNLTSVQSAQLAASSGEYLPDPIQMCMILFDEDEQALEM